MADPRNGEFPSDQKHACDEFAAYCWQCQRDRAIKAEAVLEALTSERVVEMVAKSAWDAIEATNPDYHPAAGSVDQGLLRYALRSALPTALQHAQEQVGGKAK